MNTSKIGALKILLTSLLVTTALAPAAFGADTAKELLQDSDRARGGISKGIAWNIKIQSFEEGDETVTAYRVRTKGDSAHAELTEPARNKGEIILFNDPTIWFFKPGIRKPVEVSSRQRLSGQAANGDIAATNYARDYVGKIVGEEAVNGEACHVLELKASSDHTTYDRIKYWISKKRKLGLKADFQTVQGKTMKTANIKYDNTITIKGKKLEFVSEVKITNPTSPKDYSVLTYTNPKVDDAPAGFFNMNNIVR